MKIRAYVSEFIGAFALLFVGVAVMVGNHMSTKGGVGPVGVALAHGLIIAAVASAVGPISGGHFNPAVTVAALIGKRIGLLDALIYIVVQVLGAVFGVWLLQQAIDFNSLQTIDFGMPKREDTVDLGRGLILEAVFTFFLAFVVYGTAFFRRAPKIGALYVGLAVAVAGLAIGYFTGGSINPVRYIGSAFFVKGGMGSESILVYVVGPLIGGALAGVIFSYLLEREPELMEGTGGPAEDYA
jgi:MIP family channel proteins